VGRRIQKAWIAAALAVVAPTAPAAAFQGMGGGATATEVATTIAAGVVLQSFESDIFTYMECKPASGDVFWVAVPRTKVAVGDHIRVLQATEYRDLRSERVNRTFARIYSAWKIQVNDEEPLRYGAHTGAMDAAVKAVREERAKALAAEASAIPPGSIPKAEGGKTIEELFAQRSELAGREVALRAKVVADLPGPWFRVMDGTGSTGQNTVIVRHETPTVDGQVVLVRGRLDRDVTLGMGHVYPIAIEAESVTVER